MGKQLLALSGTQPWFWAILYAEKNIENRDWSTKVRGTIALHAAKKMTDADYGPASKFIKLIDPKIIIPAPSELVRGAIIGLVDIVDCVSVHASPWFFGDYGFVLCNPRPLSEPIPCKGALGFWKVPVHIISKIEEQLCLTTK
ncbi:MAG: ASCH domain-containing protein [Acidobacteriota bacterium]